MFSGWARACPILLNSTGADDTAQAATEQDGEARGLAASATAATGSDNGILPSTSEEARRIQPPIRHDINLGRITNGALIDTYVESSNDNETQSWLAAAKKRYSTIASATSLMFQAMGMSRTNVNGMLGQGQMFVFSRSLIERMLLSSEIGGARRRRRSWVREAPDDEYGHDGGAAEGRSLPEATGTVAVAESQSIWQRWGLVAPSAQPAEQQQANAGKPLHSTERPTEGKAHKKRTSLLDIGAGDGGVTSNLAHLFDDVYATEVAWAMRKRLAERGYTVVEPEQLPSSASSSSVEVESVEGQQQQQKPNKVGPFDCVALLNVLDRCDKPLTLLRDLHAMLKPPSAAATTNDGGVDAVGASNGNGGGRLILAVVLPWCPFVEEGQTQKPPSEVLPLHGARCADRPHFETCVSLLVERVLAPCGWEVESWTRVPYLCEGSRTHEYYALDDALFVLRSTRNAAAIQ